MSLVKQTHELTCPDEALTGSYHHTLPRSIVSDLSVIKTPWKLGANQIVGSKPFRKDVSHAKAKSESMKATAIQRTYLPTRIR
jgi:hypothetical protein